MTRQSFAMFTILSLIIYVPSTAAAGAQLNANEVFGSDVVKEMPLIIGAGLKTPLSGCGSISGSIAFTPKALRVYVFKGEDEDPRFSVQADNTQHARNITIGNDTCQVILVVTRREAATDGSIDLPPASDSGVPGAERNNVLDEQGMYITAAYFPSSQTDCGRLNTTFKANRLGLMLLTNLANGFSIKSRISDDHFYRTLTFMHKTCITSVDVHFYGNVDGGMRQEEQK